MKIKKILFILTIMLISFLTINNVHAVENYGLWVNGEEFTSEKTTINCDEGTATYNKSTNTLRLNNVTINSHYEYSIISYQNTETFNISLIGTNKIYGEYDYAISSNQDMTISGTGSLYIDSYNGICAYDNGSCPSRESIKIEKVKNITFESDDVEITTFNHNSGEGDGIGIVGNIISNHDVVAGPFGDNRDASSYQASELYQMRAMGWINYLKIGNYTVNNIQNNISTSQFLYIPKNGVTSSKMHIGTASYDVGGDGMFTYDGTDSFAYGGLRYFYNINNVKIIQTSTGNDVTKTVKYNSTYNTFVMPNYDITIQGDLVKVYKISPVKVTTKMSNNIVTLTWKDPGDKGYIGAIGYNIYIKEGNSTTWEFLANVKHKTSGSNINESTYQTAKLDKNTRYAFKIVAYYVIPYGDFKDKIVTSGTYKTTNYLYTQMNLPTVTKYSSKQVRVRWKKVEGVSGYQIARSAYKSKNYSIVKTLNSSYIGYKLNTKKDKTYYYKVRSYRTVNGKKVYSPWSNYKSFRLQ